MILLSDDSNAVSQEWKSLVRHYGVLGKKSHDARLVASMRVHRIAHVLTHNVADFQRYSGIVVMHPESIL
jgi:hypothetical protein